MRLTDEQLYILNMLAACGGRPSSVAPGRARRCSPSPRRSSSRREGFETLLVCFNSPLARLLADETLDVAARTGRLHVRTFHQLAEDLGREAGTLPAKPDPVTAEWFDETLPDGLDAAIERLGPRYHAIVVDEGQDFERAGWRRSRGCSYGGRRTCSTSSTTRRRRSSVTTRPGSWA